MKIERIYIENYRIIRHLDYKCANQINVFVGINGAGKSTMLYALRTLLSWFVAKMKNSAGRGIALKDQDINNTDNHCLLELVSNEVLWSNFKQRSSKRTKAEGKTDLVKLRQYTDRIMTSYYESDETLSLPVVAFYGVDRTVTSIPQKLHRSKSMCPLDIYNEDLSSKADFRLFFEWFREREDIENEEYRKSPEYFIPDRQLQTVRRVLSEILPEYDELKVHRAPQYFSMRKGNEDYNLEFFSDGEKCYITLFGDIARKLAMANPMLENPLMGSGIILIDEIDLHLHPTWQMKVLKQLKETFPNCQFFITTHSPQVVSSVDSTAGDILSIINNGQIEIVPSKTFGKTTDNILREEFAMRSVRGEIVQEHIDHVWNLLKEGDYSSQQFADEMEWLHSHLDLNDPEFSTIDLHKAILKKKQGL